jgi:phage terminase large subunit-like protein
VVATVAAKTKVLQRVTDYAERVVSGEIVAGQLVKHACQRHLDDWNLRSAKGIDFDDKAAHDAIRFIELLKHSKGEWAGRNLVLSDWQVFIVGSVFGWYRDDGTRRFREAYTEVARKNGKTTLLAAIGLYLAFADGEPGAEVYSAATKRDQAKLCWSEARAMAGKNATLSRVLTFTDSKSNMARLDTLQKFEPLGRDADTADGLNPHAAIIDELHAHPNRGMVDVLRTAVGARRNPLLWSITTAGAEQTSIWWEMREYAISVLDGTNVDDGTFVYIATMDKGDDWRDETLYQKGNPNLGVSVKLDALIAERDRANQIPAQQNAFRRLRLNEPTEQSERWIDMAQWDECADAPTIAPGDALFVGLDLSSKIDLSGAVALRYADDGYVDVLCRFWRPEDSIHEAEKRDGVPYRMWAEQGYIELMPGTMIDPAMVAADLIDWLAEYEIREIPFDTWNAASAAARLEVEGATIIGLAQGYATYSEPCHVMEGLLAAGLLRHGGNPVLRWMAGQMVVKHGPNDAIRPWKPHGSGLRNDGIVAMLMALNRALIYQQQDNEPSILFI